LGGRQNRDFIVTDDLLKAMWALSESPWRAWGKGRRMLNAEELYWLLRDYGIDGSERLKKGLQDFRGLYVDTIFKAFERYRQTKDAVAAAFNDDDDDGPDAGDDDGGSVRPSTPPSGPAGGISAEVSSGSQFQPTPPTLSPQVVENEVNISRRSIEKNESKINLGDVTLSIYDEQLT
jgi:hypothetical protein